MLKMVTQMFIAKEFSKKLKMVARCSRIRFQRCSHAVLTDPSKEFSKMLKMVTKMFIAKEFSKKLKMVACLQILPAELASSQLFFKSGSQSGELISCLK